MWLELHLGRTMVRNTYHYISSAVPYPATERLTEEQVFDERGVPRMDVLKTHFIAEGK